MGEGRGETRIEVDQASDVILFVIDDVPAAMLDKDGLHVRKGVIFEEGVTFDERLAQHVSDAKEEACVGDCPAAR